MTSRATKKLLSYRYLKGIGRAVLNDICLHVERTNCSIDEAFNTATNGKYGDDILKASLIQAEEQADIASTMSHRIISRLDPEFPSKLKGTRDCPPILYCSGDLSVLNRKTITIIGTREPTQHGQVIADRVTSWFTSKGWVVASGLAKGVDTIAHKSCLNSGGSTIAVLAHGLEKIYPAENKDLARKISSNQGLLITEYGYNSYVGRANFVERDRIQAALANAVILVQSDIVGGSLHASRASLNYGRYLIVLGQSLSDIAKKEPKIEANLTLINGSENDILTLLKVKKADLERLISLPDKSHLDFVESQISTISDSLSGTTIDMF